MKIDTLVLGPLLTNCYILRSERSCWIVDPGIAPGGLLKLLEREKLTPQLVLLTHGHGDHIAGIVQLKAAYPRIKVACPAADAAMLTDPELNLSADFGLPLTAGPADHLLTPGQTLEFRPHPDPLPSGPHPHPDPLLPSPRLRQAGPSRERENGAAWRVLDTSGHTPGGVSYYCEALGVVITGDALFAGSVGRCDMPGGDIYRLVRNIRHNLLTLPPETRVLPGHGEETTIGRERQENPFVGEQQDR